MNITEPIRRRARTRPRDIAIIGPDGRAISYAGLEARINSAASEARAFGLRPGDLVRFDMPGVSQFIFALGLARLGVATAPSDLPQDSRIGSGIGARITITNGPAEGANELPFDPAWNEQAAPEMTHQPSSTTMLRVFSSSGTTGRPKYIPWTHALLSQLVHRMWLDQGATQGTLLIAIPLDGISGMAAALRCLYDGACLLITDLAHAAAAIREHQVGSLVASPFALRQLLDTLPEGAPPFPIMRAIEASGARIPPALAEQIHRRLGGTLLSHYGATEMGRVASAPTAELAQRPGAAGYLLPGVTLQTVDATDTPLPAGTPGIIRMRAELMVPGYLGATQADSATLRDGWFYPGDIGHLERDGMLILQGRASDLINVGGVKINPTDIEDALLTLPGVTDATAFGVPDPLGLTQLWAAISATRVVPTEELNALFAQRLAGPTTPRHILQVAHMPRTANGKIRKEPLIAFATEQQASRAPQSGAERHR